jgi:hypothetical protein
MAVENKYVNSDVADGKKVNSAFNEGQNPIKMVCTFEVAAADDDGSVFRLFKNVNPDLIPVSITLLNDAITGCTSVDLGLYEPLELGGAEIDKNVFLAAEDINGGNARSSAVDGLTAVAIENVQKKIYELAGHTLATRKKGYDICLTANTIGSAAGTISVIAEFIQG